MPGGAPCRAGDREAEDPETPPCEDGLSAASATAGKPAEATASGFPDAALSSLPDPPSAMPPHVTTPHERAPLPGGMSHVRTIYEMLSRTISPLPNGRGRVPRERDRVRDRPFRRSLLNLLSCGRRPHPCPSPVRATAFTHFGLSGLAMSDSLSWLDGGSGDGSFAGAVCDRRVEKGGRSCTLVCSRRAGAGFESGGSGRAGPGRSV